MLRALPRLPDGHWRVDADTRALQAAEPCISPHLQRRVLFAVAVGCRYVRRVATLAVLTVQVKRTEAVKMATAGSTVVRAEWAEERHA